MTKVTSNSTIFLLIYILGFIDLLGVSMIIPLLSRHVRSFGASPSIVGFLGSTYGTLQLISSPLVGHWSDLSGRQNVLLICLLCSAGGYFMLGAAASIVFIFVSRIPAGLFKHSQSICKAYLSDIAPASERARVLGRFNSASSVGFIVGPVIGGHLSVYENGFLLAASCAGATFIFCSAVTWWFLPETCSENGAVSTATPGNNVPSGATGKAGRALKLFVTTLGSIHWAEMWDLFLVKLLLGLGVLVYRSSLTLVLEERFDATPVQIGYLMSANGVIAASSGMVVGYITNLYANHARMNTHFTFLLSVVMVTMVYVPSIWFIYALTVPLAFSTALLRISATELLVKRAHGHDIGTLIGASQSILSGARSISPFIGGLSLELGAVAPVICSAVLISTGCVVLLIWPPDRDMTVKKQKSN